MSDPQNRQPQSAYEAAGVSISAGNEAVRRMGDAVRSTYDERVLAGIGSFGGVYDASGVSSTPGAALVASTDGVGTKTMIASAMGRYESIGQDIVNHCINDILVQGAEPLFFLDYIAAPKIDPAMIASVVSGIAFACRAAGCVLLGGETAEMPGVYAAGQFDLVGTIVGLVQRERMLPLPTVAEGDVLLGLASNGMHTNGFSLARRIFAATSLSAEFPGVGILGEALLAPHRSYLAEVRHLRQRVEVKALAHLTGGGFIENIPRVLPQGLSAQIERDSWPVLPIFRLIQDKGQIAPAEMFRVFNMGIGMVAIVAAADADAALAGQEGMWRIGQVVAGQHEVLL
jgi:phosphoribosylformylglycinamidine cyclo-ligase